ncbi:MAG: recombination regulator RecX [Phycisphaerae bacterium]|nr:recombination regulator RecX [Phycisphaerae bacterium]
MPATFDQIEKVRLAALRLLQTRARSRAELTERLLKRRLPREAVEHVVTRFVETGLVDDDAFARDVVRSEQRHRPAGDALLRAKLEGHGVDDEVASVAIDELESEASTVARANECARRTAAQLPARLSDRQRWQRVLGALARRGFDAETSYEAARDALGEPPEAFDA